MILGCKEFDFTVYKSNVAEIKQFALLRLCVLFSFKGGSLGRGGWIVCTSGDTWVTLKHCILGILCFSV